MQLAIVNLYYLIIFSGLYGLPARTGKIKDLSRFDASFFGVHAKQANVMCPQLRLLLESTYETMIDAGKAFIRIGICYVCFK